jgi:hypothetical protein
MRSPLIVSLVAAVVLIVAAWLLFSESSGSSEPKTPPERGFAVEDSGRAEELGRLSAELDRLSAEVRRLSQQRSQTPIVPMPFDAGSASRSPRAAGEVMPLPAQWYLDQYVLSFEGGGRGSEYFRLAVDAYARELVDPIVDLVIDGSRPAPLRQNLITILGTPRFSGNSTVIEALLAVIRAGEPRTLALIALKVLPAVGGPGTVAALERIVWSVATEDLSVAILRAVSQLAGNDVNAVLLRILISAPGTQVEALRILISLLNGGDPESALQCFMRASTMSSQPVRLVAANRIGEFTDASFKGYVVKWLGFETDPQVREALERASKQQGAGKSWGASRAVGPPDANPDTDDPNAWASAQPDGGREWLELDYSTALVATSVRIYEVNMRGAVAEVHVRDSGGVWHTVWTGTTPTQASGPLTIEFQATSYAVNGVRVVLDTSRSPGWNEIDAVELVGPQGRAWASDARASSSYGH